SLSLCFSLSVVFTGTESSSIRQESGLMSANVGDTLVLHCFHESDMAVLFSWYKQTLGDKLQLFSTVNKYDRNATFYHEFKDNPRFSVENGQEKNHLRISDMQLSDSGTYYCGSSYSNKMEFGEGAILIVKASGSRNMTVLQQSVSETVQPGDSVTLNCTIHTETCAGEHSVYWFRHGSGESHPGIIYTHGDRNDQCENSPEAGSPTQSCVYNLPKRNLSLSDAGTYYCAVASCGQILFGKGTKLDIEADPLLLVYCLGVALALLFILIIVLACIMYKMYKRKCRGKLLKAQDGDSLHYVALNLSNNKNRSRRQRNTMEEETVYSGIRQ
uniref:Ig-like domain-containing protein n=1 Tax=Salmo trutta TaxID=8032 RepID=A0A673VKA0_SALTR